MQMDPHRVVGQMLKIVLISLLWPATLSVADETGDGISTEMAERWRAAFDEISNGFQISRNGEPLTELGKSTVLNIWNAAAPSSPRLGRVYLWTEQGRPVALGSIMTGHGIGIREEVNIVYELHSLDSQPLQIEQRKVLYDCPKEGIEWLPLADQQPPASSRVRRLIQMREIARSFSVQGTNLDNDVSKYTLIPNPLYRYERETSVATDGAIFAIGTATDPTVYLLVEVRNNQWWVAFARSTIIPVRIEHNDQLFYEFERTVAETSGTPFYIHWIAERRYANAPETRHPTSR